MSEAVTLQDVYSEIQFIKENMVSKQEFDSVLETFEILHNPETLKRIEESEADIKAGRTKRVRGVKDLLVELK
ncbi:MAG: hypothetical protein AABX39_02660 [Nanoarchaeota archaeon]